MTSPISAETGALVVDPASSDRRTRARIAANMRWAHETDRSAATSAARAAANAKFEQEVDPDGVLPPHDRAVRAEAARRAHFLRMSLKSAKARRKTKPGKGLHESA